MQEMMQDTLDKVQGTIWQLEQQLPDPDEGLEVRPDVAERIQRFLEDTHPHVTSLNVDR